MALEATVICIDNSDWSRNGDFSPSRFEAQQDAANLICGTKTDRNIENVVGILTMAGERVEVRVTPTNDIGKILSALHNVRLSSTSSFIRGIQTAQLALKHRTNKNHSQRIIFFCCSPISTNVKVLEQLGKQLKKNNISIDIVSFGDVEVNSEKLKKLFEAVNSNDTSHFLECPSRSGQLLSDLVLTSLLGSQSSNRNDIDSEAFGGVNEFGVDPNIDPDLYLALRMSLEEEQSRNQLREQAEGAAENANSAPTAESSNEPPAQASDSNPEIENMVGDCEMDDDLREALSLSLQDYANSSETTGNDLSETKVDSVIPEIVNEENKNSDSSQANEATKGDDTNENKM